MNEYAGFWRRSFARIIESLIVLLIFVIAIIGVAKFFGLNDGLIEQMKNLQHNVFVQWVVPISILLYFLLRMSGAKQASPGKRLVGIYVGNLDGEKVTFGRVLCREAVFIICCIILPLFLVSMLLLIFTSQKASLHDYICKTRVFRGKIDG